MVAVVMCGSCPAYSKLTRLASFMQEQGRQCLGPKPFGLAVCKFSLDV
jgi:hypothetical protein